MKEVLRSSDPVRLSFITALLADAGIEAYVLDTHMSILEGSASAIPRRLMVADECYEATCRILEQSGEPLHTR